MFVDVLEDTFNLDPEKIAPAYNLAQQQGLIPKVVIAVDLFGLPADYHRIRVECERLGLLLLEDGAQGFGGEIESQKACSFGDISTTSFFPAKPLGCYGDGGAVFTDNDEWATLIRSYAVHGKGTMKYDNVRVGMNSRLDAMQAAILSVKFQAFRENELDAVNLRSSWYNNALQKISYVIPSIPDSMVSSWAQYTVKIPSGMRDDVQKVMTERSIPTMVYYPKPMQYQTAFDGRCLVAPGGCPITKKLCQEVLSLPMGPYLTRDDIHQVSEVLVKAFG